MSAFKESQTEFAQRMYDARASTYDDSWHPAFVKDFLALVDVHPGQHVLDLACGTGLVSFLAASRVGPSGKVVGIDVSQGMLGQALARKEREEWENVQFLNHDIAHLGSLTAIAEESFDLITCASALVLLEDPKKAVQSWTRYVKPGGRIILDVPHPNNFIGGLVLEVVGRRMGLPVPYNRSWVKSEESVEQLLEQAGLKVEKIVFQAQMGGGSRSYDVEEADDVFAKQMISASAKVLRDAANRERARAVFAEEWENAGDDYGQVMEIDGVFVAVARKGGGPDEQTSDTQMSEALPDTTTKSITGSCRCGDVRYTVKGESKGLNFCHCRTCQKLSGAGYMSFVDYPVSAVSFAAPSALQTVNISPYAERSFCSRCGAPVSMKYRAEDSLGLTLSSMDVPAEIQGHKRHIFLKEKAPWETLPDDGWEKHEEMPGMAELLKS